MIKKILFLMVLLGVVYYWYSGNMDILSIGDNTNYSEYHGAKIMENETHVIVTYASSLPDEVYYNSLNTGKELSGRSDKDVLVIGFFNISGEEYPVFEMDFSKGVLEDVKDLRSDKLKVLTDLWIYDFMPVNVEVSNNIASVSLYHFGDYDSFKEDVVNVAFNIFEDTGVDKVEFTLLGGENNIFIITQEDVFGGVFSNSSYDVMCPSNKQEAYRKFVNAYNKVTEAQQKEDFDLINKTYEEYLKARECYELF